MLPFSDAHRLSKALDGCDDEEMTRDVVKQFVVGAHLNIRTEGVYNPNVTSLKKKRQVSHPSFTYVQCSHD